MTKSTLGGNHHDFARNLNNLAGLYVSQGRYEEAEPLLKQALELFKSNLGENHPDIATSLNNLAELYQIQGHDDKSELFHKKALELRKSTLGENHPDIASSLNNLGALYIQTRYKEAEPLLKQALQMFQLTLGADHDLVSSSLNNLSAFYQSQGNSEGAISFLTQGLQIEERHLKINLGIGAESQKQSFLATIFATTDSTISLHLQAAPNNPEAAQLAFTTLLRRKGIILDTQTNSLQRLSQNLTPADRTQLEKLTETRSQLATLYYGGLGKLTPEQYKTRTTELQAKATQLEADLNNRSAEFKQQTQSVTIEAIQSQIPTNTTLVELIRYKPYNSKAKPGDRYGNPHYAAYLLTKDGKIDAIDLGEAAPIDQLAAKFRRLIQNPSIDIKPIARQLDAILMQPIRAKLAPNQHLLLSPDSYLNLIPFAALVDENNRYLLETTEISYLSSGRDLLHRNKTSPTLQPSLILANPNYQTAISTPSQPQSEQRANQRSNQRTTDLSKFIFSPLPGTAEEATAIAPKLSGATLLTEAQATETALKATRSPRILHIATHGFFLQDKPTATPKSSRSLDRANVILDINDLPLPTDRPYNPNDNPLLRSGLALAGANTLNGGNPDSDGILTALEASNLNLRGTQLVVLSACETGLGDIANGEGVYGLRRAFTLAGAETQLISLWKVSDNGTKDLMVNYYDKLLSGTGRSQSLLETQRKLLADPQYRHPYYWAPFILSGDWTPLH